MVIISLILYAASVANGWLWGYMLTDARDKPIADVKILKCRECLTFWLTLITAAAVSFVNIKSGVWEGIEAYFVLSIIPILLSAAVYSVIHFKFKIYE